MVHGAVKARIQLGFDYVGDHEYNLKPLIKDLQVKVGEHTKPLITSTVNDPITTRNTRIQISVADRPDVGGPRIRAHSEQEDAERKKIEALAFVKRLKQDKVNRER